jgi:hypothetical protein
VLVLNQVTDDFNSVCANMVGHDFHMGSTTFNMRD